MLRKITIRDTFGAPVTLEGEVLRDFTQGYDTPGGGWSCYPSDGATPAQFWAIRWKGKRQTAAVNKRRVLVIE